MHTVPRYASSIERSRLMRGICIAVAAICLPLMASAESQSWFARPGKSIRYQPEIEIGLCLGMPWYEASSIEIRTVQGIRFNPNISAGIGLGLNINTFGISIPATFNFKYIVLAHKNTTPFISLDAGWSMILAPPHTGEGAPCGEFAFGLRHRHFQYSMGYYIQAITDSGYYFPMGAVTARFAIWF